MVYGTVQLRFVHRYISIFQKSFTSIEKCEVLCHIIKETLRVKEKLYLFNRYLVSNMCPLSHNKRNTEGKRKIVFI